MVGMKETGEEEDTIAVSSLLRESNKVSSPREGAAVVVTGGGERRLVLRLAMDDFSASEIEKH